MLLPPGRGKVGMGVKCVQFRGLKHLTPTLTLPRRGGGDQDKRLRVSDQQDQAAQALYDHLVEHVLCAVMSGDAQVLRDIQRFGRSLHFVEGRLHFTLPDLFEFVAARCAPEQGASVVDYRRFRRLLYSKPTNATLKQHGCVVELAQSNPEHALGVYRLVPYQGGAT
jgi:hypothetical protein